ncbi:hypothetical protein PWT90_01752 [Aphanocladium album]|nr:hypothetical protein PWT90_01752 [Aphanocladium album]
MLPQMEGDVIVASKNPVKIGATKDGFTRMFPDGNFAFKGCSVGSGVSDQPLTDQETLQGALNRARNAQELEPAATYWIGLEGGVQTVDNEVQAFAWIVVLGRDNKIGRARTSTFFLPQETTKLLRSGLELGDADNLLYSKTNSKHQTGTVGILTGDLITRQSYYTEAVILALIPFKNTQLTFRPDSSEEGAGQSADIKG